MKYKAVIFDLFGTLIDKFSLREGTSILRQMASVLSVPADDFAQLWFDTFDTRGLGGFKSIEANIDYICQKLVVQPGKNETKTAGKMHFDYTVRSLKARPQAIEVLAYLKSHGYRTALITNCSIEIPSVWSDTPFAPFIDVAIFSCSVGVQKPDPGIYKLALEQLAVSPGDCVYIGDGDCQELTGAAAVGMHPVLIRDPDEDSSDVHRVDYEADEWDGPVINSLGEVLNLLE